MAPKSFAGDGAICSSSIVLTRLIVFQIKSHLTYLNSKNRFNMDATILTTFFCFILLIINLLLFTQLRELSNKLHHYVDRSDLHSEKLRTIISILQQLEAKQDLMFNNAPPVPGEITLSDMAGVNPEMTGEDSPSEPVVAPKYNWMEQLCKPGVQTVFLPSDLTLVETKYADTKFAKTAREALSKPVFKVTEPKKRGRKPGVKVGPYTKRPNLRKLPAQSQAEDSPSDL